jgi:hypothetical protein
MKVKHRATGEIKEVVRMEGIFYVLEDGRKHNPSIWSVVDEPPAPAAKRSRRRPAKSRVDAASSDSGDKESDDAGEGREGDEQSGGGDAPVLVED